VSILCWGPITNLYLLLQEPKPVSRPTVKFRDVQAFLQAKAGHTGQKRKSPGADSDASKAKSQTEMEDQQEESEDEEPCSDDDDGVSDCESDGFLAQEYVDLKAPKPALRDMLSTVPIIAPAKLQAKRPVAPTLPVNLPLDDSDWKM
jgi:hypothetical protein